MTLLARPELSIAWLMPAISLRRVSLAIRAAGASLPVLILKPVERRCNRMARSLLLVARRWVACNEAIFVLIRLMVSSVILAPAYSGATTERRLSVVAAD